MNFNMIPKENPRNRLIEHCVNEGNNFEVEIIHWRMIDNPAQASNVFDIMGNECWNVYATIKQGHPLFDRLKDVETDDYDGAIALTGAFLSEDPENPLVAPLQGLSYYRKGDYESAISVFQRQEDIGNDTYPIHYYLGQSYWHTKVMYRAEEELLTAWQIDSSDVNLAYSIAAVKSDGYRPFEKEVKPWLDKAWEMIQPDPATMSRLHQQYGLGYYRRQDSWDKAIEHYKEAYRYNPKFISALSTIAYCYEIKKDYKHALEWYEKYLKVATPGSQGYEFATKSIDYLKGELFMEENE